jgi:sterol 3beta-glucosyltransferase
MRIAIMTMGTWGDVMPFMALAKGLTARGFDVTLVTSEDFEAAARNHGIAYARIRMNFGRYVNSNDCKAAMAGSIAATKRHQQAFMARRRQMLDDCWHSAQGSDAIICNSILFPAYHIAEKRNIPLLFAGVSPLYTPTRAFPYPYLLNRNLGPWLNRLTWKLWRLTTHGEYATVRDWCLETVKTRPPQKWTNYLFRRDRQVPVVYFYSPSLVPRPKDWHADTFVSGYWYEKNPDEWSPPDELSEFLNTEPEPIYIGFGSIVGSNPARLTEQVMSAIRTAGERAVVATGWGGMVRAEDHTESVYCIESIPHEWIFPRVKAVVHHGGAGTTWNGLRFGRPTLACPMTADHWFWAKRIHRLGAGPRYISQLPWKPLRARDLAQGIRELAGNDSMQKRAEQLGRRIRKEDGVARAVEFIGRQIESWRNFLH